VKKTVKQKDNHYISAKESRNIAKNNIKTIKALQKKRASYKKEDYLTEMRDERNVVEFDNLHTYFYTDNGTVKAVNGVSFDIPQGSTVGVVGESGCGKSVTSLSLMQLVQGPMGQIVEGSIRFRSTVRTPVGTEPIMVPKRAEGKTVLDENGNPVMEPKLNRFGKKCYRIVKNEVNKVDEIGTKEEVTEKTDTETQKTKFELPFKIETVMTEKKENGETVLDESGNPVMEPKLNRFGKKCYRIVKNTDFKLPPLPIKIETVMTEKKEEGEIILDEGGNPVMVQALNKHGKPRTRKIFEEHEEVYDIAKMPVGAMASIRGREISMIFQEPMTSLNPVFTIGMQLDEVTLLHVDGADKETAKERSIEMLKLVGIAMPEHVYKSYPHQLSGGMRQRVMIAMALCCNPKLIIADEPTTALDVTIQAQILDLLRSVKDKISGSIMLITHDLGVIAEMVDYVVVMYAGRVVEKGTVSEIFKNPLHPYTIGLQKSKPVVGKEVDRLYSIPGNVPNPINMPATCYFKDRCDRKCASCNGEYPGMIQVTPTHFVACHLYDNQVDFGGKRDE